MPQIERDKPVIAGDISLDAAIDQLSVLIMVEGVSAKALEDLAAIANTAAQRGSVEFADRATEMISALRQDATKNSEAILKAGITELKEMLTNEKNGLPATNVPPYKSLGDDAELVADFLIEAREHLSLIEGQMLTLERDPTAMEIIHAVFRAFHTIKGLAGFLGFSVIQAVAHEVETLLDLARNEKRNIDSAVVDIVLESADFLLAEMASIDSVLSGAASADPADNRSLISRIKLLAIASPTEAPLAQPAPPAAEAPLPQPVQSVQPAQPARPAQQVAPAQAFPEIKAAVPADKSSTRKKTAKPKKEAVEKAVPTAQLQTTSAASGVAMPAPEPTEDSDNDNFFAAPTAGAAPLAETIALPPQSQPAPPTTVATAPLTSPPPAPPTKAAEPVRSADPVKTPDSGSVRVETAKLDYLMDMVGEMVIAQSLIRHSQVLMNSTDSRLVGDLSHLARVTAEVQRATMSMRMVPVAQLFQKIERVIRDLSRKAGKQVVLQTSGTDTEVDKTVVEELSDPLLHMVRNSVDHGVETSEERIKTGKNPVATIKLSAYHQGGQVVIEISDDGRGLNAEKIRLKAEQKELISPNEQLTEEEVFQLIFAPGFSTAEKITDVSGRGVGMDVVRRNVEKLRGRIDLHSVLGQGTTFLLKLPLTLAIIDGLVVEVGRSHYIVRLSVVREIFRPLESTLFRAGNNEEMVLVREQLLPIVRLNQRLGVQSRTEKPSDGLLVVVESDNKMYCLLVDDLLGKQEVVIKSLGETFENAWGFSGCAVLGDGRVGLILDTDGIYRGRRR